ncbi:hypothetical protein ABT317_37315, partial [Streptomyces carpinensis]
PPSAGLTPSDLDAPAEGGRQPGSGGLDTPANGARRPTPHRFASGEWRMQAGPPGEGPGRGPVKAQVAVRAVVRIPRS